MFDIVLINPPYVVTTSTELEESQQKASIEASWAGGLNGTELLYGKFYKNLFFLLEHKRTKTALKNIAWNLKFLFYQKNSNHIFLAELLPRALDLMTENGIIYLIAIAENKLDEISKWLISRNCQSSIVIKRRAGREMLFLIKITRL